MAKVDFQEILSEEVMKKRRDRNSELIIKVLEERVKEDTRSFLDEFNKILIKNAKKENNIQNSIKEDVEEKTVKEEDDGDILISDMILEDEQKSSEENKDLDENKDEDVPDVDISQEDLDERYEEDDLTTSQKTYAYIYEQAMREYFNLKIKLEKQNVRDGELAYDDKNFLKLMRLKEVATRAEMWFKNSTHGSYVGDKIDEISDMEKKNERELLEYKRQVNKDHEQTNEKVAKINEEKNDTLDRIDTLTNKLNDAQETNQDEIIAKIDELNLKYVNLNKNLEAMSPNSIDIARQEEKAKQQANVEQTEYGFIDREKQRKSANMTVKAVRDNKESEKTKEKLMENGTSASNNVVSDNIEDVKKTMEAAISKAYEDKDYDLALKLVENYQKSLTNDINKADDKQVNKDAEQYREKIAEKLEDEVEKEEIPAGSIITGIAVGVATEMNVYPPKPANIHPGIPGLSEVMSPEEIATNTVENNEILKDVEDIANGNHTREDNDKDLDLDNKIM